MATEEDQKLIEGILSAKEPLNKGICWEEWDERENAIDSLEQVAEYLDEKYVNRRLKRVSIALDHAFYSFTICAIKGTNYEQVLKDKGSDLIGFWTSLERLEAQPGRFVFSVPVVITDEQKKYIGIIHNFANDFKHFVPMSYLIKLEKFPEAVNSVIQVIKSIYSSGDFPVYHLSTEQKVRVQSIFDKIASSTLRWKEQIGAVSKLA
ncbi:MAG: hypothetical protein L0196_07225 [candidate division Zixibacteria bacterium]|nr:hypothetical protein [candidate division Zixibacteria bacterium]